MTGGLVVDGHQALDRLRYGPGVFDEKWVRARVTFADGGDLLVHDPRRFGSLELAPGREPPRARRAARVTRPSWRPPWPCDPAARAVPRRRSRPG